jgi:hypothetical protein
MERDARIHLHPALPALPVILFLYSARRRIGIGLKPAIKTYLKVYILMKGA